MDTRYILRFLPVVLAALLISTTDARAQERDADSGLRFGVLGGIGLDPELIVFGGQAQFGPLFHEDLQIRPGVEFGMGEITSMLGVNVDVLYRLPGSTGQSRWMAFVGAGPTFGLSHRGFGTDIGDDDNVNTAGVNDVDPSRNRFDFSDTDFNGGMNFIAGARNQGGLFFELRATAWGVSNVRFVAGFNF